jgi:hypothetical protein
MSEHQKAQKAHLITSSSACPSDMGLPLIKLKSIWCDMYDVVSSNLLNSLSTISSLSLDTCQQQLHNNINYISLYTLPSTYQQCVSHQFPLSAHASQSFIDIEIINVTIAITKKDVFPCLWRLFLKFLFQRQRFCFFMKNIAWLWLYFV